MIGSFYEEIFYCILGSVHKISIWSVYFHLWVLWTLHMTNVRILSFYDLNVGIVQLQLYEYNLFRDSVLHYVPLFELASRV